ncbi:hypothetical protein T492DRAFT_906845 [Pavlovales sp. CCMP2436]|nr:hypothetical protein T492DRAFT_906845 [Pavlovales sp. CCMP2436]
MGHPAAHGFSAVGWGGALQSWGSDSELIALDRCGKQTRAGRGAEGRDLALPETAADAGWHPPWPGGAGTQGSAGQGGGALHSDPCRTLPDCSRTPLPGDGCRADDASTAHPPPAAKPVALVPAAAGLGGAGVPAVAAGAASAAAAAAAADRAGGVGCSSAAVGGTVSVTQAMAAASGSDDDVPDEIDD